MVFALACHGVIRARCLILDGRREELDANQVSGWRWCRRRKDVIAKEFVQIQPLVPGAFKATVVQVVAINIDLRAHSANPLTSQK